MLLLALLTAPLAEPPPPAALVCIHGFMSPKWTMGPMVSSFRKQGWTVYHYAYPSRSKTIEEHAEDLVTTLTGIAKNGPGRPISFVTHSMGGLVLRTALNQPSCPPEAKQGGAVLLGPPNQGSSFARALSHHRFARWLVGSHAGRELMTTPVDGFDRLGTFPMQTRLLIVAGTFGCNPWLHEPNDGKVCVAETCLPTPHRHEQLHVGHSWMALSPAVISRSLKFLNAVRYESPQPAHQTPDQTPQVPSAS